MASLSDLAWLMALDRKRKFIKSCAGLTDAQRAGLLAECDVEQHRRLAQGSVALFQDALGSGGEAPGSAVQADAPPKGRSPKG